jgi:nucleotide-binding universal stress UspA family protein
MKRILVPIDFSTGTMATLGEARRYADAVDAEVLLLHVVEGDPLRWYTVDGLPEAPSSRFDPTAQFLLPQAPAKRIHRDLYAEAQWKLEALLPPRPERFRALVTVGKVADEIVRVAREQKADLIIMGERKRRGLRHLLRRGVVDQVCRKVHIPVLMVHDRQPCLSRRPDSGSQKAVERQAPWAAPATAPEGTARADGRALRRMPATSKRPIRARRIRHGTGTTPKG